MIRSIFLIFLLIPFSGYLSGQELVEIKFEIPQTHTLEILKPTDPVSREYESLFYSEDTLDFKKIQMPLQKGHLYFFRINHHPRLATWVFTGFSNNTLTKGSLFYPYRWLLTKEGKSVNDSIDEFELHLQHLFSEHQRTSLGEIIHNYRDKKRLLRIYRDEYVQAFNDSSISDLLRYYKCMRYVEELIYSPEYIPADLGPSPRIAAGDSYELARDFFHYQYVWKLAQLEWSGDVLSKDRTPLSDPNVDFNTLFKTFPSWHFEDRILARACMVHALLKNRRYLEKEHFLKELKRLESESAYPSTQLIIHNLIKDEFYLKAGSDVSGISIADSQGDTVNLSDLKGQAVLLDFWATWCRPCRKEDPYLQEIEKEFPSLRVLKISVNSNEETVERYFKKRGIEGPNFLTSDHLNEVFGVYGLPTYILIDPKGLVRANPAPMPSDPAFRALLEKMVNE